MEIQKTSLRIPKPLHEALLSAASNSGISMNAEILSRLQSTFHGDNDLVTKKEAEQIARTVYKELEALSNVKK